MKKTMLLLTVSALLFACEKDSKSSSKTYCWTCTIDAVTTATGTPAQTTTSSIEECNITEKQAREIEKAGSGTTTSSSIGLTVTTKSTTRCIKK